MSREKRICQNCKSEFWIEPKDFKFYDKVKVPPPTWCPECRFQRRALYRNERKLFWAKSGKSGKEILSLYPPEAGVVIYDEKEWRSDEWDPMSDGRDYDFSKPFFQQFFELSKIVPRYSRDAIGMVDSDYSANASYLKNCYLLFNSNYSEDSAYGNAVDKSAFCFDNSHLNKCERCYDSFWLTNCYQAHFSSRCEDCNNVWFSKNCRGSGTKEKLMILTFLFMFGSPMKTVQAPPLLLLLYKSNKTKMNKNIIYSAIVSISLIYSAFIDLQFGWQT